MIKWMEQFSDTWKQKARQLKVEVYALYLAYRDPRVSWAARIFTACVVAYALSPIDLIPDFIPVIGYLDDLILIPLGVKIALSMIPEEVMTESRIQAQELIRQGKPVNWAAAIFIALIWVLLAAYTVNFMLTRTRVEGT